MKLPANFLSNISVPPVSHRLLLLLRSTSP